MNRALHGARFASASRPYTSWTFSIPFGEMPTEPLAPRHLPHHRRAAYATLRTRERSRSISRRARERLDVSTTQSAFHRRVPLNGRSKLLPGLYECEMKNISLRSRRLFAGMNPASEPAKSLKLALLSSTVFAVITRGRTPLTDFCNTTRPTDTNRSRWSSPRLLLRRELRSVRLRERKRPVEHRRIEEPRVNGCPQIRNVFGRSSSPNRRLIRKEHA